MLIMFAFPASSILSRVYYSNGGKSKWIISLFLTLLFLIPLYFVLKVTPTQVTFKLFLWYVVFCFLSAADNLMYAWAYAHLPASTASLLASFFGYIFLYFCVFYSKPLIEWLVINAVVVIATGAVIIGLDSRFWIGTWELLIHSIIGALLGIFWGLHFMVMLSFFAMTFTIIGTVVSGDLNSMNMEAKDFKKRELSFVMFLFWSATTFRVGGLGATTVLFLALIVLVGVVNAVRVPITSITTVVCMHDTMSGFKILALVLAVWGFVLI